MDKTQKRAINVSLRVIADLSQGLYRSPADALKELVSNAYDADSPTVEITFAKDFSFLLVQDQGQGMTIDDFIRAMETIGGSPKRSADTGHRELTPSGRKIIGRIGIGLLSISQIANNLEIQSTTEGSSKGFRAQIEFDQFASEEARKIKITDIWETKEVTIGSYFIEEVGGIKKESHFTNLKLSRIKPVIMSRLDASGVKENEYPRMMGRKFFTTKDLVNWMRKNKVTKSALHEYDRMFWELCVLCPVPYMENAIQVNDFLQTTSDSKAFSHFAKEVNKETQLELKFDGITCYKPILMPDQQDKDYPLFFNLLFMEGINGGTIKYTTHNNLGEVEERYLKINGYFYFQRPKVWPPELQGILIRVRNVTVGQYDSTFLTYKKHEAFKFSQISGEIYVDDLDEALNIDRSSFRETESSFIAFRDGIHNYLSKTVFPGIKEYANLERQYRHDNENFIEQLLVSENFGSVDKRKRSIIFQSDQKSLVQRSKNNVSFAASLKGKKLNLNKEFYRILAFLEYSLSKKLNEQERDKLYEDLVSWLASFERDEIYVSLAERIKELKNEH